MALGPRVSRLVVPQPKAEKVKPVALAPLSSIWATIHMVALAIGGGGATAMEAATEEDEVLHMSRANKVAFAETTGTAFLPALH